MKFDRIKQIALFLALMEHAVLTGLVIFVMTLPAREIPLVDVELVNLPANLTMGISLPGRQGELTTPSKPDANKGEGAEKQENLLPASDVGVAGEGGIAGMLDILSTGVAQNVRMSGGKVSGLNIIGTGIVTAKPDNVFLQFKIKSDPKNSLAYADKDADKKIEYIADRLKSRFKLKKENFKVWGFSPEMLAEKQKNASFSNAQNQFTTSIKQTVTKFFAINDLGKLKIFEICEIIDRASELGAIGVAEIPPALASYVESSTVMGAAKNKISQTKGVSKNNIKTSSKAEQNEFINYHFNEETLEKLVAQARQAAYKEAKEKFAAVKKVLKFNENEMDVVFNEEQSTTTTEEGEITIRIDVTPSLDKTKNAVAAPITPAPTPKKQ
ncbi:MAG: hypothetical protein WCI43_03870 [Candidatus Firestonebacteria bacterium]